MPALAVLGACLAWAVDNNLTRKVSLADATWTAAAKGTVAGGVNLALAFSLGAHLPAWPLTAAAMAVGLLAYGVSLVLFIVGMRHLGTARTGAYFSVAPFIGAALALATGEPLTPGLLVAGGLIDGHGHLAAPERAARASACARGDGAQPRAHPRRSSPARPRPPGWAQDATPHLHRHEPMVHTHAHFPDAHHRGHGH